jgi:hypothetical protein
LGDFVRPKKVCVEMNKVDFPRTYISDPSRVYRRYISIHSQGQMMEMVSFEVVSEDEFPQRKRTSKYKELLQAVRDLGKGQVVKVPEKDVKVGTLRTLLQKEKGKFGIGQAGGYLFIRKKG